MAAEGPRVKGIGMLASPAPAAVDQARMVPILHSDGPGRGRFMERVDSRSGIHTREAAAGSGYGPRACERSEF